MATMDIFTSDAFRTVQLTSAFEKLPYIPTTLGSMGIFDPVPSRTRHIAIEKRDGFLTLIPTTPIGAPITQLSNDKRDIRDFRTVRVAKGFTIYAEELNGIRAFGSESELMQVQAEVMRRANRVMNDKALTDENMRLGALQGILYDADGTTVIRNWFTEWGITASATVNWALDVSTTEVRTMCQTVIRAMRRAGKGAFIQGTTEVHALVGDDFYDALISHASVKTTFQNWNAATELRKDISFDTFYFGGIFFHNYRGTDDNSTLAIPVGRAIFFPVKAPEVFQVAYGPAEFEPWVNTLGQEMYALTIPDRDRNAHVTMEMYSYPLYICTRPEMLQFAKWKSTVA